jgi:ectoine hydroxylase-related dioxygenase (phytanoyl-CoA dioxygenase family)
MANQYYGGFVQNELVDNIDRNLEELTIKGYTLIPNLIPQHELAIWRQKIDAVYAIQKGDFGYDALKNMHELDVCRAPLLYDPDFLSIAADARILHIVKQILGEYAILNLQNAIINRPGTAHHQSAWHQDLAYQNHIISRPLAINALIAVDEFSAQTGGTHLIPFSHKLDMLPSDVYIENNQLVLDVPAGTAIVFDSMMFHRAGKNTSQIIRRAINHLYTIPIIKQQYDFPRALANKQEFDPAVTQLLGFNSQTPVDDKAWRRSRYTRMTNNND